VTLRSYGNASFLWIMIWLVSGPADHEITLADLDALSPTRCHLLARLLLGPMRADRLEIDTERFESFQGSHSVPSLWLACAAQENARYFLGLARHDAVSGT
jgi:hypothetical protein